MTAQATLCDALTHARPARPKTPVYVPLASVEANWLGAPAQIALILRPLLAPEQQVHGQTAATKVIRLLMECAPPALKTVCLAQYEELVNVTMGAVASDMS